MTWLRGSILASILLVLVSPALAKEPTLDHIYPAGGLRGSTVEVTASGTFERWPIRVWASHAGLEIKPGTEKGKLSITIATDCPPGVYWLRLFDDEGVTSPRAFQVGTLPEVLEVEPNDEPGQAQKVDSTGVTVNGQLIKNGEVDGFRVTLRKGQTLVASMEANRRLGSPMDGMLQVASTDGFVLVQNDDDLDRDPRIFFQAPSDGEFLVRAFAFPFVQESSIRFSGAPGYVYRLTLTTNGMVDHAYPLSVTTGSPSEVDVVGWNIPSTSRRIMVNPGEPGEVVSIVEPALANPVEIRSVEIPSRLEVEPNDRAHPQRIALPVALSGLIDGPGDVDHFDFLAHKDEKLLFRLESRAIGQPLDSVLRVGDASGSTIVEVDDAAKGADPEVRFTAPAEGTYRLSVRDLNGQGGPRYAYLLTAGTPRPDFALTLKEDRIAIIPGKPLDLLVTVERREGYAEAIEIGLVDRFDGVIASSVESCRSGPTAGSVTLKLLACDCARPGPIRVVGLSREGVRRPARARVGGSTIDSVWLTPTKPTAPAVPAQPASK